MTRFNLVAPASDSYPQVSDNEMLNELLKQTFAYFRNQSHPESGLVADKTQAGSPCSIGVMGMALTACISGVERNLISRTEAAADTARVLRFLYYAPQSRDKEASGYKGFFYHFLDMRSGKRVWKSELSSIDTALFIAGALVAAEYFTLDNDDEKQIRELADKLYRRVDWQWALNGEDTLCHGWKPGSGFLPYRWDRDYSEAMILYALALGSPTFPIPAAGYKQWTSTFSIRTFYDIEYVYAGPLFIHQFSHLWLDFRGIQDDLNRSAGFDYFENSKRATYIHRAYAIQNPRHYARYSAHFWGLSASDGPGKMKKKVNGETRIFFGYLSRGAPEGPDDGTVSPWAVVASLPFAPDIVLDAIRFYIERLDLKHSDWYGFNTSFNPTFPGRKENAAGWVSPFRFGLNEGAIITMIENYQTGLIWKLMRQNDFIRTGLKTAGFRGGWLDDKTSDCVAR